MFKLLLAACVGIAIGFVLFKGVQPIKSASNTTSTSTSNPTSMTTTSTSGYETEGY